MQLFKSEITVTGVKSFKGDVDGNSYDSTTVFALAPLANGDGYETAAHKWGDSNNHKSISDMEFPFQCQAEFELQSKNGKGVMVLKNIDLKSIKQPSKAA